MFDCFLFSKLAHPNVVQFFGIYQINPKKLGIVVEICDEDLLDYSAKDYGLRSQAGKPRVSIVTCWYDKCDAREWRMSLIWGKWIFSMWCSIRKLIANFQLSGPTEGWVNAVWKYACFKKLDTKMLRMPRMLLKCVKDALCGLVFVHDRGLIHLDIKPSNILVSAPNLACLKGVVFYWHYTMCE